MDDLSVAIVAPTGRDAELMGRLMRSERLACRTVDSISALMGQLCDGYGASVVVIAEEAMGSRETRDFVDLLDLQPRWSDLPVLLLASGRDSGPPLTDLVSRRAVEVLFRPLRPETLAAAVRAAVENRRRQYEIRDLLRESERLNIRLDHRTRQLRRLSLQLSDAEERERRRLATYVHDDLQQILAGTAFHLDVASRRIDDRASLRDSLSRVRGLLDEAIAGTRNLSQELSPTSLRRSGLVAALKWLAEHVRSLHGLRVDLNASSVGEPADGASATFLFRATQELLLNVVKHAGADRAEVSLRGEGEHIELVVRDHGRGFPSGYDPDTDEDGTFGLFGVRERAELFGGSMEIESEPGIGSAIRLRLPRPAGCTDPVVEAGEDRRRGAQASGEAAGTAPSPVRVVLVDDHAVVRSGLKMVLVEHPQIDVVGEFSDGRQAVEAAASVHPDLMLMDVAMPEMDGVEATRLIKHDHPEIRVIGLSMFDDRETADLMIEAGAEIYLSKSGPSERLVEAILTGARQGETRSGAPA